MMGNAYYGLVGGNGGGGSVPVTNQVLVATATGTPDVITASYSPALSALTDRLLVWIVASGANTVAAPTFSPDGLTAHPIVKKGGLSLAAGDIPGALAMCGLEYNAANTRWELLNPATGGISDGGKGDITVSGSGAVWTIDQNAVTYQKSYNGTQLAIVNSFRAMYNY